MRPRARRGRSFRARLALGAAAALASAALAPRPAAAQENAWPPKLSLWDGAFTMEPTGILQLDLGTTFGHSRPGGPSGGLNPRRARLGVEGKILDAFEYVFEWDFGGTPGSRNRLYQASISYGGLGPAGVIAGVFEPTFSLQQARDASNLLFLERATVVRAASSLAAGSGRVAAELRASGERWFASAALTGGRTGPGEDSSQRGAVARLAGLAARTDDLALHLGVSGLWSFRPPRDDGVRSVTLSENAELSLDARDPPLDTGSIPADSARAGGVELGLAWRHLQVQGEWYRIGVARPGGGGALDFSGWYAQASWTVVGRPRQYRSRDATWGAPSPEDGGFDLAAGRWGAVEVGGRISTLDLNDGDVRGGRQRVLSGGLGWWPQDGVGVFAQYQHVEVTGGESGNRRFQALALRAMVSF